MLYIFISLVCGLAFGFASLRYENVVWPLIVACFPVIFVLSRTMFLFLAVHGNLPSKRAGDAPGEHTVLTAFFDALASLHPALYLFPIFVFAARIITWFFTMGYEKEEITETRDELKHRIRASYNIEE